MTTGCARALAIASRECARAFATEASQTPWTNKAHPDKDKLKDADREDLDELERSQREVAELFEKIKSAFEKKVPEPKLP